ncbi:MAG: bifunctional nicotinamidase/pyrazinamidase [Alphaproteobacteria bacterium]|nr:bifunctional nicotinamidase/pyrazinamidase [Alphaproteobacteria bacterium]
MSFINSFKAPPDSALIIVDVQNDFCPGGNMAVTDGDKIIPLINAIKPSFSLCVFTQDWHQVDHKSFAGNHKGKQAFETIILPYGEQTLWPDHCIQRSKGAEFHKGLKIDKNDLILKKGVNMDIDSYSGFFENDRKTHPRFFNGKTLTETLKERDITKIVICGLAYDFCVGWHALDARKEGFTAIVVKDACRSLAIPLKENGINTEKAMDKELIKAGVKITNVEKL